MARFLAHDPIVAEDLVQESMLKALRAVDSFEEGTHVKALLITILRRTHIDWLRSNGHHSAEVSIDSDDVPVLEAPHAVSAEDGVLANRLESPDLILEQIGDEMLIEGLRQLPDAMRWTLLLVDVEQIDHEAAAAVLGVPVGTVKSRAHRGRALLRRWLLDHADARLVPETPIETAIRTPASARRQ
jgi:RNA polymerase sigma-70 factor (ECF subfamily)